MQKVTATAVMLIVLLLSASLTYAQPAGDEKKTVHSEIAGVGELILEESTADQVETTRLLLQKPGGARQVIDSYEGLLPAELLKYDLDGDGNIEVISVLKPPDGIDVMPFIYTDLNAFRRVFPPSGQESNTLICREVFVTTHAGQPAICSKNLISYHEFGPPDLFRLEFYRLEKDQLKLVHQDFSAGDHFNILMNRGGYAMHSGQYLEALDFYNQSIASASGEISTKAYIEALFNLAQARKFTKDFKSALELFQRIVVEFSENAYTTDAQREIELISGNQNNIDALSFYVDVLSNINCDRWEAALELLQNHPVSKAGGILQDRFLFTEAEVLTALNRVEEAIKVLNEIKEKFPDSPIIENVDALLTDMQERPEETDGL